MEILASEFQDQYLIDNYKTKYIAELAKTLGIKKGSVRYRMKRLGLSYSTEEVSQRRKAAGRTSMLALLEKQAITRQRDKTNFPFKGYSIHSIVYFASVRIIPKAQVKSKPTLKEILEDICTVMNMPIEEVQRQRVKKSKREISFCKFLFCYLAKRLYPTKPHKEIAAFIGYKEHTMSMYAVRQIEDGLSTKDPVFLNDWYTYIGNTTIYKRIQAFEAR